MFKMQAHAFCEETDDPRLETLVMRLPSTSRARRDYDLLTSGKPQVIVRLDEAQMEEIRHLPEERCPDCSFDPTSLNDYCSKHRPK